MTDATVPDPVGPKAIHARMNSLNNATLRRIIEKIDDALNRADDCQRVTVQLTEDPRKFLAAIRNRYLIGRDPWGDVVVNVIANNDFRDPSPDYYEVVLTAPATHVATTLTYPPGVR